MQSYGKNDCRSRAYKMRTMGRTIRTLLKAFNCKGHILLFNRKQIYSEKHDRASNIYVVTWHCPVEIWKELNPDYKPHKETRWHDEVLIESFKQADVLKFLGNRYKELFGGGDNEKIAKTDNRTT